MARPGDGHTSVALPGLQISAAVIHRRSSWSQSRSRFIRPSMHLGMLALRREKAITVPRRWGLSVLRAKKLRRRTWTGFRLVFLAKRLEERSLRPVARTRPGWLRSTEVVDLAVVLPRWSEHLPSRQEVFSRGHFEKAPQGSVKLHRVVDHREGKVMTQQKRGTHISICAPRLTSPWLHVFVSWWMLTSKWTFRFPRYIKTRGSIGSDGGNSPR